MEIIYNVLKYVKHMEFSNLFLIQESFTVYTPNLFCLSDHLRNTFAAQSTYLICLYSLTLNLTWWGYAQCADNSGVYKFSAEYPCLWQIRYFNSILGPIQHISLFSDFWHLNFSLICAAIRYYSTTKVD